MGLFSDFMEENSILVELYSGGKPFFGYPECTKHAFIRTHTRISHNIFFYCYIRTHDVHPLYFVHFAKHKIIMFDYLSRRQSW